MALPVHAIRAGSGLVDLFRPDAVGAIELGHAPDATERAVYRVLGARQIVQAVVVDRTGWVGLGLAVDLLHAASMVALAARGPARYRRAAIVQSLVATAFAASGVARA